MVIFIYIITNFCHCQIKAVYSVITSRRVGLREIIKKYHCFQELREAEEDDRLEQEVGIKSKYCFRILCEHNNVSLSLKVQATVYKCYGCLRNATMGLRFESDTSFNFPSLDYQLLN